MAVTHKEPKWHTHNRKISWEPKCSCCKGTRPANKQLPCFSSMEAQLIYQGLHNVPAYSVSKDVAIQRMWGSQWRLCHCLSASPTLPCTRCRQPGTSPLLQTVLQSQNLPAPYVLHRAALQRERKGAGKEETWTFYFSVVDSMAGLLWRAIAC